VLFTSPMNFAELRTFLQQGGITMGIIVLGSVAALFIGIERVLFLRGFSSRSQELHQAVIRAILRGDAAQAVHECDRAHIPTAALYRAALDRATRLDRLPDAVDRARREVVQALRAPLWILGTLGAVMPFVGLFGTVWGILHSFRQMQLAGTGGFAVVAGGISEALITTAGGIAVAVEAVVLFNYFQARVSKEAFDLTLKADELVEAVQEKADVLRASLSAARPAAADPGTTPAAQGVRA
jgi:biopolymer transport protein ExbB